MNKTDKLDADIYNYNQALEEKESTYSIIGTAIYLIGLAAFWAYLLLRNGTPDLLSIGLTVGAYLVTALVAYIPFGFVIHLIAKWFAEVNMGTHPLER